MRMTAGRRPLGARLLGAAGLAAVLIAGGALFPGAVPRSELSDMAGASPPSGTMVQAAPGPVTPSPPEPASPRSSVAESDAPPTTGAAAPSTATGVPSPSPSSAPPSLYHGMPAIAPSSALTLSIPAIRVDATVLPVDSTPTGQTNAWGGQIYRRIDFPVDDAVRQWIRRGDPNSLPESASAGDVKAFDRVVIYGHASDIGNHLVFQDLSSLKPGARIIVTTAKGRFTYRATLVTTSHKTDLDQFAPLYDYPKDGRKEIALVACLPDTELNTVVLGDLVSATGR